MILSSFPVFSLKPRNSLHSPSNLNHEDHSFLRKSTVIANHKPKRRCDLYDLHREVVPYGEAWSWQNAIVKEKKELNVKNEDSADTLIFLQHSPVYTLGAGSSEEYLNFDAKNAPFDLYRTERGGEVTYHGPGQLVMYPIINLRYQQMDLHWYLRTLEEVVIRALFSTFAIEASRVAGLTGVWVGNKKLAAIGIKVTQWIAYHGLALNVSTDLIPFQRIVPCGIRDREVGSIKELIVRDHPYIDDRELIEVTYDSLLTEFSEVFQLDLSVVRHNRSVSSEKQSNTKGQIQHPEQSLRA